MQLCLAVRKGTLYLATPCLPRADFDAVWRQDELRVSCLIECVSRHAKHGKGAPALWQMATMQL